MTSKSNLTDKSDMYIDLETEIYLQKLDSEIRQQVYWGVVPEIPIAW
ncbi:MAG: hypothetical protein ACFN4A_06450 [Streptococcus mutans]|nr:hypothetical protein [Streptococcus mutans]EMC07248.1 hypothetical protein SMU72_08658 [Streptococcus mutans NLML9]MCB5088693.1 hypothetical protein [Streptococcus mutans]